MPIEVRFFHRCYVSPHAYKIAHERSNACHWWKHNETRWQCMCRSDVTTDRPEGLYSNCHVCDDRLL